jgi:pimeloyl-ACP methyl ester carboxylesterase
LRFDYRGHGQSEGAFEDGCIGLWFQDALRVIDTLTQGPLVLAGSSMGGWIGLLVARARPERVQGFVGIAAAPDFTKDIGATLDDAQKEIIRRDGVIRVPNHYSDDPYVISKLLLEDGPAHYVLEKPLALRLPVRLLQGMKDEDVPWQTAFRIKNALADAGHEDAEVLLVEDGDHRLSRPEDLSLLDAQVRALSGL